MYRPPYHFQTTNTSLQSSQFIGKQYCMASREQDKKWLDFFSLSHIAMSSMNHHEVSFNTGYLGLDIIAPIHNSILEENKTQVIMAVVESPTEEWSKNMTFTSSVNIDPPTHVEFADVFLGEKSPKKSEIVGYLYKMLRDPQFQVSSDLAVKSSHFMVDFDQQLHPSIASENALSFALQGHFNYSDANQDSVLSKVQHEYNLSLHHGSRTIRSPIQELIFDTQSLGSLANLTYTVKILAFNRPRSLVRLLNSLNHVDFTYFNFEPVRLGSISLEFLIDANRTMKVNFQQDDLSLLPSSS
jgi:hypothetical protein